MEYPELNSIQGQRLWTEQFVGLDRRPRAQDGAFSEMENLSGGDFPLLETRKRRGLVAELTAPRGLIALNGLAWVDGGTLYYNGEATPVNHLSELETMLPKRLVAMGAYILIFPDAVYYNTVDGSDYGSINRLYQSTGSVAFTLCTMDGIDYPREDMTVSDTAPQNPSDGDYWLDTSGEIHTLNQWRDAYETWIGISSVYVKIAASGIGAGLNVQDNVKISGISYTGSSEGLGPQLEFLNATHIAQAVGEDYIVVIGVIDQNWTQTESPIRADRELPEMDFLFECNNRLWGCHYGDQDGETVNRIYCSALGDFKNFSKFQGTSQDSYFVAVGSEGPFTGGISHRGYPYFFKNNCVHKIYGDRPSNFEMQTTLCDGVQSGSGKTLTALNGALYYLGEHGPMYFESLPDKCGEPLGQMEREDGCAGGNDGKWYLSVREDENWSLYVLDTARGIWHREDGSQAVDFAAWNGEMYMLDADGGVWALNGTDGTLEDAGIQWMADTAMIGYEYPDHKYMGRFTVRVEMAPDADLQIFCQYDSDGVWVQKCDVAGAGRVKTYLVPIVPRRCEHMQLRFRGRGQMRLYGIARTLYMGSDGRK